MVKALTHILIFGETKSASPWPTVGIIHIRTNCKNENDVLFVDFVDHPVVSETTPPPKKKKRKEKKATFLS